MDKSVVPAILSMFAGPQLLPGDMGTTPDGLYYPW